MSITFRRIQKQITHASSQYMHLLRCNVGKNYTGSYGRGRPKGCGAEKIGFAQIREAEEPEDCVREASEKVEPETEGRRLYLWGRVSESDVKSPDPLVGDQ